MAQHFDAVIIGAGQAGPSLAVRLATAGMKVAIVERKLFGGTCVNTGCIPTKALVASAQAAFVAHRAADFGLRIEGSVHTDMKAVKARKDRIVQQSRDGVTRWLEGTVGLAVLRGQARFVDAHTLQVSDETLHAERIFINVGGRALVPQMPGIGEVPFLTNSSMMEVDFLPEHLLVVGGSYIGLEFAQMYCRFGSRVTVVEMGPRLVGREDEEVSDEIRAILEGEGIEVRLNAKCIAAHRRGDAIALGLDCEGGAPEVSGSHLLLAVGRVPNTADLGLEQAGIETDERGYIKVDDELRTSQLHVWALGDCNGRGAFTHTAYNDYEIVAGNLLDGDSRRVSDRIPAYALFTDPPLGRAGMNEKEARATGRPVLCARRPMTRVGRAVERGETRGFMKVLVDADSKRILGAALLGLEGDEVIHTLLDVMYAGAPYTLVQRAMHIHPTVSELLPTLLGDLKPLP